MPFISLPFILIALLTFLSYWSVKNVNVRNWILVSGCYVFYAMIATKFTLFLFVMSLVSFMLGNYVIKGGRYKRAVTICAITFNLVILIVFKYYDFFINNIVDIFDAFGMRCNRITWRIIMPMGLSFYTFMLISHVIDCSRGCFNGERQKGSTFFAYVSFFPHLIAGPIDRSRLILPQMQSDRTFSFQMAREGMWQILNGLVKKMVVADVCAEAVNDAWGNLAEQNTLTLTVITVLYSVQIYCDFSGFSDIAIGLGKLFGLKLMDNFKYPYFARNISEFWRRWHISLTSWFTEYVYIPLGGNRKGKMKTCINTLIIFVLCGFWHGANWGYGLWGLICGLLFMPYLLQKRPTKYKEVIQRPSFIDFLKMFFTFDVVSLSWIVFRGAESGMDTTFLYLRHLMNFDFDVTVVQFLRLSIILSLSMFVAEWLGRNRDFTLANLIAIPRFARWLVYLGLVCLIWWVYLYLPIEPSADQFIYQNF